MLDFNTLAPGGELPPLHKAPVSREQLSLYAEASGDRNPIHLDDEVAKQMGLGGVIAHGMLSMGFLGHYLAHLAGPQGVRRLRVRFAAMVRPDDTLTCKGVVGSVAPDGTVQAEIWAENQRGEKVTAGDGEFVLTPRTTKNV